MAYRDLSLPERHAIIRESVANGIHRLSDIEAVYDAAQQSANEFADGGSIHIAPSKRGTFTAAATKHGESVQAFASQVLAHKENYSPAMVKKANFARNFGGHRHGDGGHLTSLGGPLVHQHGFGDWLNRVFGSQDETQPADTIPQEPLTQGMDYRELRQRQAYTESKFNNNAKSPAGAVGIFQVTPNVLSDYNKANKTEYKVEDLTDQVINSTIRDWQMQALMQRPWVTAGGANDSIQFAKALSGYNWGSTNTVNALNKAKADGVDIYNGWEWLSYLPKETQDYINFILRGQDNSIMRNDSAYHARIKARPDEVTLLNEMKTGGPLYPFSFSKRGIPPVRY